VKATTSSSVLQKKPLLGDESGNTSLRAYRCPAILKLSTRIVSVPSDFSSVPLRSFVFPPPHSSPSSVFFLPAHAGNNIIGSAFVPSNSWQACTLFSRYFHEMSSIMKDTAGRGIRDIRSILLNVQDDTAFDNPIFRSSSDPLQ